MIVLRGLWESYTYNLKGMISRKNKNKKQKLLNVKTITNTNTETISLLKGTLCKIVCLLIVYFKNKIWQKFLLEDHFDFGGSSITISIYCKKRLQRNVLFCLSRIFDTEQLKFFSHSVASVFSFVHHHTWNTQILQEMLQIKKWIRMHKHVCVDTWAPSAVSDLDVWGIYLVPPSPEKKRFSA